MIILSWFHLRFQQGFKILQGKKLSKPCKIKGLLAKMVLPATGIEPVREYKSRRILSPVRLPVPPRRHFIPDYEIGESVEPIGLEPMTLCL